MFLSATAFYVFDTLSRSIVTSFETATSTTWEGGARTLHFDPISNTMWAVKNGTTISGISASSYTVTTNITPSGAGTFGACAIDTKKQELWFFWEANQILVYSVVTGLLLRTLTSTIAHANTSMTYIPERNAMLVYIHTEKQEI